MMGQGQSGRASVEDDSPEEDGSVARPQGALTAKPRGAFAFYSIGCGE